MAKGPSAAVLAARGRRSANKNVEIQWFIDNVSDKVSLSLRQRTKIATELLKTAVVRNISRPVTRSIGPRGGKVVSDRSKEGEFPKADSTQLMKSIFMEVKMEGKGVYEGYVGTPLNYGLILETRRNRSFLVRTMNEERSKIKRNLTGPIK